MAKQIKTDKHRSSPFMQLVVNFALPLIILNKFSSESSLGPIKAFLVALAFPLIYELYSVFRYKKYSIISAISIGGILITGGISLLELSEGWLAVRRSAFYAVCGLAILLLQLIKPDLIQSLLSKSLDFTKILNAAKKRGNLQQLKRAIANSVYGLSAVLFVSSGANYLLTRALIKSTINTSAFNHEYANLRLITLPVIILPTIVAITVVILLFLNRVKKLTGIQPDELINT